MQLKRLNVLEAAVEWDLESDMERWEGNAGSCHNVAVVRVENRLVERLARIWAGIVRLAHSCEDFSSSTLMRFLEMVACE